MRLYMSLTSPYARKVRVALIEQNAADQVEEVVVDPFEPPPELLAANPLSKIPTLITDRGEALPDSNLILDYLQSRYAGLAPLPRGSQRWAMLRLRQLAEGVIDAAVATVVEKRRPESIVYAPYLDRQAAAIRRAIEVLELEVNALAGIDLDEVCALVQAEVGALPGGVLAAGSPLGSGVGTDAHPPADGQLLERRGREAVASTGWNYAVVDDRHSRQRRRDQVDTDDDAEPGGQLASGLEYVEQPFPPLSGWPC